MNEIGPFLSLAVIASLACATTLLYHVLRFHHLRKMARIEHEQNIENRVWDEDGDRTGQRAREANR